MSDSERGFRIRSSGNRPVPVQGRSALRVLIRALCLLVASSIPVQAQQLSAKVMAGFEAYKGVEGAKAAVEHWVAGGPLGRIIEPGKLVKKLHKIEFVCGEYQNYEVFRINELASRTQVAYLVVNYRLCPVFARFLIYQVKNDTVITEFNMRTKPEEIFPAYMLAPGKK